MPRFSSIWKPFSCISAIFRHLYCVNMQQKVTIYSGLSTALTYFSTISYIIPPILHNLPFLRIICANHRFLFNDCSPLPINQLFSLFPQYIVDNNLIYNYSAAFSSFFPTIINFFQPKTPSLKLYKTKSSVLHFQYRAIN